MPTDFEVVRSSWSARASGAAHTLQGLPGRQAQPVTASPSYRPAQPSTWAQGENEHHQQAADPGHPQLLARRPAGHRVPQAADAHRREQWLGQDGACACERERAARSSRPAPPVSASLSTHLHVACARRPSSSASRWRSRASSRRTRTAARTSSTIRRYRPTPRRRRQSRCSSRRSTARCARTRRRPGPCAPPEQPTHAPEQPTHAPRSAAAEVHRRPAVHSAVQDSERGRRAQLQHEQQQPQHRQRARRGPPALRFRCLACRPALRSNSDTRRYAAVSLFAAARKSSSASAASISIRPCRSTWGSQKRSWRT